MSAAVPTVVLGLLQHMSAHKLRPRSLKRLVIGGAAAPRAMIQTLEGWVADNHLMLDAPYMSLMHVVSASVCLSMRGTVQEQAAHDCSTTMPPGR